MGISRVPLLLYRRHTLKCHVHKTGLSPRAKRNYMDCSCPIWMFGSTETGYVPRQSTATSDLAVAEAQRQTLLRKGRDEVIRGPRIDDCIERFLLARKSELADLTSEAYELLLGRLEAYCATRGALFMRELTVDLLEDFKVSGLPAIKDTSKRTAVARLKCFLKTAYRREWITSPLALKVESHVAEFDQKEPYTDSEVALIMDEAERMTGGWHGYASSPHTFRLLLELMLETGMRVSDAIRFDPSVMRHGDSGLWIYTFQQKKRKRKQPRRLIDSYISDRLKLEIDTCHWLSPGLPFWNERATGLNLGIQVWQRMQSIGERCGVADCRPHRLRDTFAVRSLLRGLSIDDVSRLLGHTNVQITQTYYAKWVTARSNRLESLVFKSLVNPDGNTLRN